MHHQMGIGQAAVDFFDAVNRQNIARGFAGEFVRAVAGANGNGQGIELGAFDEVCGLLGVGEQLLARHDGVGSVAVFFVALHGFQGAQAAELAFHRHAQRVGHVDHFAGDFHVVVVAGNGFTVGL